MKKDIDYLVDYLNHTTRLYDEGKPEISDKEWDDKYFQLQQLEKETGYYRPDSPTQKVNYQVVNELKKVKHNHPMLSLEKTKDLNEVENFIKGKKYLAMFKMDGLTCSLTYENGYLVGAETRGDGEVGEDILHNALTLPSIPRKINYQDKLIVDGEVICTYNDFKPFSEEYKNPRNFAAGSIRLLDSNECAKRNLTFVAWDVIEGLNNYNSLHNRLTLLENYGFTTVPYFMEGFGTIEDDIKLYAQEVGYPIDGIVFKYDDIEYGKSLGQTAHHLKNALAYKFYDEEYKSKLINIEWSMGRTGILTPVAIFEPVEIDGTQVTRASLHNITVLTETLGPKPHVGQEVWITKRNMIIPQIERADKSIKGMLYYDEYPELCIPEICPICGQPVVRTKENDSENLVCGNASCEGKLINKLVHFTSKKSLDIKGLSEATLNKLMEWGWVNNCIDIMNLKDHRAEWINKPGFGEKSVDKILNNIETARHCSLANYIVSLGIPLIGTNVSKELVKNVSSYEDFREKIKDDYDFRVLEDFAEAKDSAIKNYDYTEADKLVKYMIFEQPEAATTGRGLDGKTFVITGSLEHFNNRAELQAEIERLGGKVSGSVSKKTDYLINNDTESTSAKNQKAKALNIPIISEKDFLKIFDLK